MLAHSGARSTSTIDRLPFVFHPLPDQLQPDDQEVVAVLPKPPFACDLTLEQELEAFEQLKPTA